MLPERQEVNSKDKLKAVMENLRGIVKLKSPDLFMITSEGARVQTHAVLLGTFSPWLGEILRTSQTKCWSEAIFVNVPINKDDCKKFIEYLESNAEDDYRHFSDEVVDLFHIDHEANKVDEEIFANEDNESDKTTKNFNMDVDFSAVQQKEKMEEPKK